MSSVLKFVTSADSIETGSIDIEGLVLSAFPANGKCIYNIYRLLFMIYDYFEEEINNSLLFELIVNDDTKEILEKYIMNYSIPTADKIDL